MGIDTIFLIVVIIFSAIIHEVMHGVAAERLGDPTARYAGRLTLNPIPHIDLFGSIILPFMLALTNSPFFFAWAKPVPYNPYNLRPGRFSEAIVAGAGPASNLAIALFFGVFVRFGVFGTTVTPVFFVIVVVNVMLCVFNLIPVPPLDGSKVLEPLLPHSLSAAYGRWRTRLEMNPMLGMMIVLLVVLVAGDAFGTLVYGLAQAIAGV